MFYKPHCVKYKAGKRKSIKPGIAGYVDSMKEALALKEHTESHFGDGNAEVFIETNEALLAEMGGEPDGTVHVDEELSEVERLRLELDDKKAENKRLIAELERTCASESDSDDDSPKKANTKKSKNTLATVES